MQSITVTGDVSVKKNILNRMRTRDIPAGVSVTLADLVDGNIIEEATPLTADSSGNRTVCKQAKILAGSTTTAVKLTTGEHNFIVGSIVGVKTLGKAQTVTDVDSTDGIDTLTIDVAIDTPVTGQFLYEMAAVAATNTSALLNTPKCITGKAFKVDQTKIMEAIPAFVDASVVSGVIGDEYLNLLKNITD